jgi:HAD superfamily 5'-nucleotidase-like hydrolase
VQAGSLGIDPRHQIYCNRSLNMKSIKAIGFDMDYTLALYDPKTFETLAYKETLKKLVTLGYPDEILAWEFDTEYMIRGLVIDKKNGNILKLDRHRYVKLAFHGFEPLSRADRHQIYHSNIIRSYEEPDFALIDTLFTLADAFLFSQLAELKEKKPELLKKDFPAIYKDVRNAIDLCHRDGSIKSEVARNPSRYIEHDPNFLPCIKKLKEAGKQVFIATNSLWDYTNVVMNHLFGNPQGNLDTSWVDLFDLVITGSAKPGFFMTNNPILGVDLASGLLRNVETFHNGTKVFQGGNFRQLHEILKIQSGSEILYVGDHIYGDILRSKKELGWRTMLVVSELENEIACLESYHDEHRRYEELLQLKDSLDDEIQRISTLIANTPEDEKKKAFSVKLQQVTDQRIQTRETLRKCLREYHVKFHDVWGELMKTGQQNSRFAAQVEDYACLYTSKFTNLMNYSLNKGFRSTRDYMPHDLPESLR